MVGEMLVVENHGKVRGLRPSRVRLCGLVLEFPKNVYLKYYIPANLFWVVILKVSICSSNDAQVSRGSERKIMKRKLQY